MEKFESKNGVGLYAYKGDAMTLLAFDLQQDMTKNFVGFTVHIAANDRSFYIYNKLKKVKSLSLGLTFARF